MRQFRRGSVESKLGFDATQNNGNITGQTFQRPGQNRAEKYAYDTLNRLAIAAETTGNVAASNTCQQISSTWCQKYGYDAYGNRWVSNPTGLNTSLETPTGPSAYLSNNRINGWGYDSAGNVQALRCGVP